MEPNLELLIALGGIATAIGAIWTAVVTRRLARATERSVAQTQQSLAEQSQHLREQNERARLNLEVDLMYRLEERFNSPRFQNYKMRSLTYVKENYFVGDDILEVQDLDLATEQLHDLFDEVGYLTRTGVLPVERVWLQYPGITTAWVLWEPAVKKLREEIGDPRWYEDYEYLYYQMVDLERQRGGTGARPTKEELRYFVEENLQYVALTEKLTTDDEDRTKE
jgi:hypothetical protein